MALREIFPYGKIELPDGRSGYFSRFRRMTLHPVHGFLKTLKPFLRPSEIFRKSRDIETIDERVALRKAVKADEARLDRECGGEEQDCHEVRKSAPHIRNTERREEE